MKQVYNRVTKKWLRLDDGGEQWVEDRLRSSSLPVSKAQFERARLIQKAHAQGDKSVTMSTLVAVDLSEDPPAPFGGQSADAVQVDGSDESAGEERVALFHPVTKHWLTRAEHTGSDTWTWHWSPAAVQANLYSRLEAEHMRTAGNMLVLRTVPESELRAKLGAVVEEAKRVQKIVPPQQGVPAHVPEYGVVQASDLTGLTEAVTRSLRAGAQLVGGPFVDRDANGYVQAIIRLVPKA